MTNISIRLATQKDDVHIALLGRITFGETFGHLFRDNQDLLDYYDKTFSVEKIENSLSKPNNVFWIAFADRLPVGYAKLKLNSWPIGSNLDESILKDSRKTCQLQKIYVLKDFLSAKIGFEMQRLLLEKASELGFESIWLSVLNSNQRAINFYKKNHFIEIGTHKFQIGKEHFDFIAMSRDL